MEWNFCEESVLFEWNFVNDLVLIEWNFVKRPERGPNFCLDLLLYPYILYMLMNKFGIDAQIIYIILKDALF